MTDKNDYYDFKLELKYVDGKVWVRCPEEEGLEEFGDPVNYYAPAISAMGSDPLADLKEIGSNIADMLLPLGKVRKRFMKRWDYKHKIRLRLCYPTEFESDEEADDQIKRLMGVPWEYICLPEQPNDPPALTRFLALRDEISIVHSLRPVETGIGRRLAQVDRLKVKMKFYSWLGPADTSDKKSIDQRIYQNFVNEVHSLHTILDYPDISHSPAATNPQQTLSPASHHVRIALQEDDLIHITCHGDPDSISLIDDDFTLKELVQETDAMRKIGARALVLLNCDSAAPSGDSIVRVLNQGGVPVVIGMSKSIYYEAARRFVGGFYYALATWPSDGLERAIVHGRLSIARVEADIAGDGEGVFNEEGGNWNTAFGLPRLFLSSEDSVLIPEEKLFGHDKLIQRFRIDIKKTARELDVDKNLNPEFDKKLRDWLKLKDHTPNRRWYLIGGTGGSGKTTQIKLFLKRLQQEPIKKLDLFYHFCQHKLPYTGDPLVFVRDSLVRQFDNHYNEAYTRDLENDELRNIFGKDYQVWCSQGQFPLLIHNAEDAFRYFVLEPLRRLKIINEKLKKPDPIILIDGIDFVPPTHHPQNSILHLLLRFRDELDDLARFLITFDYTPQDKTQGQVDEEDTAQAHEGVAQENEKLNSIQKAIFDLTYHRGEPPDHIFGPRTGILAKVDQDTALPLFEQAKHNFITGKLLSDKEIPESGTLDDLFEAAIGAAKRKATPQKVNRLLDVVATAYEPLYACDVAAIIGLEYSGPNSEPEFGRLLNTVRSFFKGTDIYSETLVLFHDRLTQYILRSMDLWHRRTTALTHELIVEAFRPPYDSWEKISNWSELEGAGWETNWKRLSTPCSTDAISGYVRRHLAHHAYQSYVTTAWRHFGQRQERARKFLYLICDPGYRIVRLAEVGLGESLQDLRNGLRVLFTEYIHNLSSEIETAVPPGKHNARARLALERMLATNDPNSYRRRELINLERKFRVGDRRKNKKMLEKFLFGK